MKRVFIFLILMFCYGTNSFCIDRNLTKIFIDTPAVIKKIRSEFLAINKHQNLYRKKSMDASGLSAEGGIVTGYYDKAGLKKIHNIFYGEMGKTETDYYFNNASLCFMYKKEFFYDKPMYLNDFKIKNITETRYYLHEGKVIRSIAKPDARRILSAKTIFAEVKQIRRILTEK